MKMKQEALEQIRAQMKRMKEAKGFYAKKAGRRRAGGYPESGGF